MKHRAGPRRRRVAPVVAVACMLCAPGAWAADAGGDAREMAATLRDMLWFPRAQVSTVGRLFMSPQEYRQTFAPQSRWGHQQVLAWEAAWQAALDTLVQSLAHNGDLATALSTPGLRLPVLKSYFETHPEYLTVDKLLVSFQPIDRCDQDGETPPCHLVVKLQAGHGGRIEVREIALEPPAP